MFKTNCFVIYDLLSTSLTLNVNSHVISHLPTANFSTGAYKHAETNFGAFPIVAIGSGVNEHTSPITNHNTDTTSPTINIVSPTHILPSHPPECNLVATNIHPAPTKSPLPPSEPSSLLNPDLTNSHPQQLNTTQLNNPQIIPSSLPPAPSIDTEPVPLVTGQRTHSMRTRSQSGIRKPKSYMAAKHPLPEFILPTEPKSLKAALTDPKWNGAMNSEIGALHKA
uniref:Uncharacterized protein n=1 Tax=Cannabis sativa TaxID=3483 RepID=A0A803NLG9_CANSA